MNKNKLKTFVLISALVLFGGALFRDKTDSKKQTKQETKTIFGPKEKQNFFNHVRDSIRNINGHNFYKSQLDNRRSPDYDQEDIDEINKQRTLGGVMTHAVKSEGIKIINQYYANIVSLLRKSNLDLSDVIESGVYDFKITQHKDSETEDVLFVSKEDMAFIGAGEMPSDDKKARAGFDGLSFSIKAFIDELDCDDADSLKSQVADIINNMQKNLISNRHIIEYKYHDYYLVNDYDSKNLGTNNNTFGYEDLDNPYINGKYKTQRKCFSMDDDSIKEFLSDSTANYIAIKNRGMSYNIVKIKQNDTVIKTVSCPRFDGITYSNISNTKPDINMVDFEFEMDTNNSVHLYFDEIIRLTTRQKDWVNYLPPSLQQKIDSLNKEIKIKNELINLISKTERHADSIAKMMLENKISKNK